MEIERVRKLIYSDDRGNYELRLNSICMYMDCNSKRCKYIHVKTKEVTKFRHEYGNLRLKVYRGGLFIPTTTVDIQEVFNKFYKTEICVDSLFNSNGYCNKKDCPYMHLLYPEDYSEVLYKYLALQTKVNNPGTVCKKLYCQGCRYLHAETIELQELYKNILNKYYDPPKIQLVNECNTEKTLEIERDTEKTLVNEHKLEEIIINDRNHEVIHMNERKPEIQSINKRKLEDIEIPYKINEEKSNNIVYRSYKKYKN